MHVDVSGIRKSPGQKFHLDLTEQLPAFEGERDEIVISGPVGVSLDVENTGRVIAFQGRVRADLELLCSRCLEHFPYPLETSFHEQFCSPADVAQLEEEGRNLDEIQVLYGSRVELDGLIRESIYLSLPMKTVCQEQCRGLCPVCGINLNRESCECKNENIDPRLAELKRFFENRESDSVK